MLQRKRSRSGPKSKSSSFIGVSQYRRTGRWEAHIWDCAKSRNIPGAKGRQLHLGSFDCAEDAARAYDRAAIHFRGADADTNYPREQYTHDPVLSALKGLPKDQFVVKLRGVAQHHKMQNQQGQKKKEKKRANKPAPMKKLTRTASMPLQSPNSVLPPSPVAGVGGALSREEFLHQVNQMNQMANHHHLMYQPQVAAAAAYHHHRHHHELQSIHALSRRKSTTDIAAQVRLPQYTDQALVYSSRVVDSGGPQACALHHTHPGAPFMLNDPVAQMFPVKHHQPHHAGEVKEEEIGQLFFDDVVTFPEDYSPSEMQGHIKQDCFRYVMTPGMEDYGGGGGGGGGGDRAEASRPLERFMAPFGPREDQGYRPPEEQMPPLMEGMGEVDTGTF